MQVVGAGQHAWEVAGLDLGAEAPDNNGNFGLGRLVVGQLDSPATLTLVDLVDNGNRADGPEALYLFGTGSSDGLSLLDGRRSCSTIWTPMTTSAAIGFRCRPCWATTAQVPFDGGYLAQQAVPEPSPGLLAAAAGFVLYVFGKAGQRQHFCRIDL